MTAFETAKLIANRIAALPATEERRLIAVAGPPASGKSTVAAALCDVLNENGLHTGLVAMDGFHLDNAILEKRGLRARKGAPETFDLAGFSSILKRLHHEPEVIVPTFDRTRDLSVGSGAVVTPAMRTIVVEGNYLLLDEPGWADLKDHWDFSVFLSPPLSVLDARLIQRWIDHGFSEIDARNKASQNDIPNAERVLAHRQNADMVIEA
ncbi:MAG: nucleoside triphosphate hydrolase [Silicimonas sp.]|nr:nucleoside triphosphate hydrolase [Silicimonas sp.]